MKLLAKLAQASICGTIACAVLCSTAVAQNVTIINFGSVNNPSGSFEDANGDPLPAGQNLPYTETIPGGLASDPAPVAFNGFSPNNINPFNVVVGADDTLTTDQEHDDPASPGTPATEATVAGYVTPQIEAAVLSDGAILEWTNVTSWNSNAATGNAGSNFFSAVETLGPTSFTITTANPGDVVTVEAIGSFERDGLVTYGGTSGNPGVYSLGTAWTFVGTATGTATGTLEVANVPGSGTPEGNVGAFRITITPAVPMALKGDVNLSGTVDFGDIAPFIAVLQANTFQAEADVDCGGTVGFEDIAPFITILQGG